ncbi:MAG: TetR/AcrR family transcriptional regulator [Thermodesulfobacteriota bacterium]|nr:TetR/AcrR family transcriptional regulator [Thermodesulfobacteriota bacterium]
MAKNSRKERDDHRRKQEILKTALSIFASCGFHGTTMSQISQDSEYPLGTIYKYFSSKKQIYYELVIEKARELAQILLRISAKEGLGPSAKLKESLFANADFYMANNEFVRIYISERSNIDAVMMPKLNEKINRMHHRMIALFEKIFEQGIENKEFKPYPAKEMAVLFSDIVHSASWSSLFYDESEEELKKRLDMVFNMFTQGVFNK